MNILHSTTNDEIRFITSKYNTDSPIFTIVYKKPDVALWVQWYPAAADTSANSDRP